MEGDKYQALASNSVSQERRKFELLVMEASSNPGRHQDFVVELLPLLSEDPHFLGCKYFGRENCKTGEIPIFLNLKIITSILIVFPGDRIFFLI